MINHLSLQYIFFSIAYFYFVRNNFNYVLLGGIRGFPIVAHQPTGCMSLEQSDTQKSLSELCPKPSYLSKALYPQIRNTVATQNESGKASHTSSQSVFSTSTFIPTVILSHISDIGA